MGTAFTIVLYTDDEATASRASRAAFDRIAAARPDPDRLRPRERADAALRQGRRAARRRRPRPLRGPRPDRRPSTSDPGAPSTSRSPRSSGSGGGPAARRSCPTPTCSPGPGPWSGADAIRLDPAARTVQLTRPGMKLDVGGIAKGYASERGDQGPEARGDRLGPGGRLGRHRRLRAAPRPATAGRSPSPRSGPSPTGRPGRTILLKDAAVSTSGDAEQFVEIDGVRYSHVVDPRTGLGLTERRSVTVIAPDGATADGLDTAACVLGPEKGLALIESTPGAAGLFVRLTAGRRRRSASRRDGPAFATGRRALDDRVPLAGRRRPGTGRGAGRSSSRRRPNPPAGRSWPPSRRGSRRRRAASSPAVGSPVLRRIAQNSAACSRASLVISSDSNRLRAARQVVRAWRSPRTDQFAADLVIGDRRDHDDRPGQPSTIISQARHRSATGRRIAARQAERAGIERDANDPRLNNILRRAWMPSGRWESIPRMNSSSLPGGS